MPRDISSATSLANLKTEAKKWLKALRAGDVRARARFDGAHPGGPAQPVLRDVQHALARDYGFESWVALKNAVAPPAEASTAAAALASPDQYEALANDYVRAFDARDEASLQRLNQHYGRTFSFDDLWAEIWRRVYAFRQRSSRVTTNHLALDEAQMLLAQDAGFGSWQALLRAAATGGAPLPPFEIDVIERRISPRRHLRGNEWDVLLAVMKEQRITALDANGLMTDEVMAKLAEHDFVTTLNLGGSRQLSDEGLRHLARMPQLEHLGLDEYPGGKLTDAGLDALRHLPNLRTFSMTWQRGITDAGIRNLRFCDQLERVNLMGSPTGDGAIEALQGKANLHSFSTGRKVTDAGLPLLQNFPVFKAWPADAPAAASKETTGPGPRLLIDGPFTDTGLAGLAGLEGVGELDLFWHVTGITAEGFVHLSRMPNLAALGADGALASNVALAHFAAIPRLRSLRIQEAIADDDGFEALSRSTSIASIWGRECARFGSRGFIALSKMPALHGFGISCHNVDDRALSTLPHFPALRELTPIGMKDAGFAHVGRCERLERLTCMYCRDTTDVATAHIRNLPLRYYYAGLTQITDRSLEILGGMPSLEQVEFYECHGISDAGLVFLARLPNLRQVALDSLPGVTFGGTRVFPPGVRVRYST